MPKGLRRYYGAGHLHFITTSCFQRRALLGTPRRRDLLVKILEEVRERYHFVVVGYVVMLEHVHFSVGGTGARQSIGGDAGDSTGVTPTGVRSGIITPNYASHFRHKTGAV